VTRPQRSKRVARAARAAEPHFDANQAPLVVERDEIDFALG
jgi:hypothetical protein